MAEKTQRVFDRALSLPAADRARLAEELLLSLDDARRAEIDAAWSMEADERARQIDAGEAEPIPAARAMERARTRLDMVRAERRGQ